MKALPLNLALICWQALNLATLLAASSPHTIVLIAFDGISQSYLKEGHASFLEQLAADSTTTEWMLHQYPAQSLPNLQSIATGLYPDIHGVRGDHILVNGSDQCIGYGAKLYNRTDVLPIWTLNEMTGGGRYSGVVAWPGFEFVHQNATSPTYQIKATACDSWESRLNQTMKWLTDKEKPANLILMHFERNHTWSTQQTVAQIMRPIDDIVKDYFDHLSYHGLKDKVNTIIVSDHTRTNNSVGVMAECGTQEPKTDTSKCHEQIWKSFEEATKELNAFKVTQYAKLKSTLEQHEISSAVEQYLNAQEIRLIINPDEFLASLGLKTQSVSVYPLFIANGPLFEPKHKAGPFENVDIYALISKKLELMEPKIKVNGSYENIKMVLVKDKPVYENWWPFKVILYITVGLLLLACGWYILRIRKQERLRF